jgi:hypothetical protein
MMISKCSSLFYINILLISKFVIYQKHFVTFGIETC